MNVADLTAGLETTLTAVLGESAPNTLDLATHNATTLGNAGSWALLPSQSENTFYRRVSVETFTLSISFGLGTEQRNARADWLAFEQTAIDAIAAADLSGCRMHSYSVVRAERAGYGTSRVVFKISMDEG